MINTLGLINPNPLPATLQSILHGSATLVKMEVDGPDFADVQFCETAGHIAAATLGLPESMAPVEMRQELNKVLDGMARGHKVKRNARSARDLVDGLVTKLFGHRHWLGRSTFEAPSLLVRYHPPGVDDGRHVAPQDPPDITLAGYRLVEESALRHLVSAEAGFRLLFIPSMWGAGKTDHILPHLREQLFESGVHFVSVEGQQRSNNEFPGLGHLQGIVDNLASQEGARRTNGRTPGKSADEPHIVIINNAVAPMVRTKGERKYLRTIVKRALENTSARIALFGGSGFGFENDLLAQIDQIQSLLGDLTDTYPTAGMAIHLKPLNSLQAYEMLTENAKDLPDRSKQRYARFAMERLAPYPRVMVKFSLPERVTTLTEAFEYFTETWQKLYSILARAQVYPESRDPRSFESATLKALGASLADDIAEVIYGEKPSP